MNEIIKSAIDRIKLKGEEIWVRYSFWTKAKDVELESGENVENKLTSVDATLSNHVSDKSNPHETTKEQVGLSYVDNTSDVEKPVSTHQREAIDASYQQSTSYTDTKIAELINGAPTTLDTLKEIADAMTNNQTVVEALEASIGSKADQAELDGHINNSTIHITADERAKWNNQSDCSEIIGTTNISNISDGTLTGAVSALNSDLANRGLIRLDGVTGSTVVDLSAYTGKLCMANVVVDGNGFLGIPILFRIDTGVSFAVNGAGNNITARVHMNGGKISIDEAYWGTEDKISTSIMYPYILNF